MLRLEVFYDPAHTRGVETQGEEKRGEGRGREQPGTGNAAASIPRFELLVFEREQEGKEKRRGALATSPSSFSPAALAVPSCRKKRERGRPPWSVALSLFSL